MKEKGKQSVFSKMGEGISKLFSKRKRSELDRLRTQQIVQDIMIRNMSLENMLDFVKRYGNKTQHKQRRLKLEDYLKIRKTILALVPVISVSNYIINGSQRLKAKYWRILDRVKDELDKLRQEADNKNEIQGQVKKIFDKQSTIDPIHDEGRKSQNIIR